LRADELPHAEQLVVLALDEFQRKHLLDSHPGLSSAPPAISRRALLRRGVTAALLPVVTSIVAPTPLQAQSPGGRSRTFTYTAAPETFIVPPGVTAVTVSAFGAQGHGFDSTPGLGGSVTATLTVVSGETLIIVVGGAPGVFRFLSLPGFNGGGPGAGFSSGGSGGGASDVRRGGSALGNRVLVAGGGGGGGQPAPASGGAGGGALGGPGLPAPPVGGGGGTQTAGGAGGTVGSCSLCVSGTAGSLGLGGGGGVFGILTQGGGGGGGGYYGGGGGAQGAGGGGGSSFADPSATGVVHVQGTRAGDGLVILTW
jgi:hypothetical protein